ncbi:MAG: hypothetical protein ABI432_10765 [Flavobacteriales bacterium]
MRTFLFTFALLALASCTAPPQEQGTRAVPAPIMGPFRGLPIRFDGYYRMDHGDVIRLMRFFEPGNVVLINGTRDMEKDLPLFLVRDTKGDPARGLHNVPVNVVGDSLLFTVRPEKGEIDFHGKAMSGSLLRFLRYSHINGDRLMLEYIFYPDPAVGPEPASK